MAAVDIGIGHDDDLVIPELVEVEIVEYAAAERRNHRFDFFVFQNAVEAYLFDVEYLAAKGQNCLEASVSALFRGAACRVALDDIDLGQLRVIFVAVAQLIGHGRAAERRLAADGLAGLAGGLAGAVGRHGLLKDGAGDGGVLLKIGGKLLVDDGIDQRADIGIAELGLGLALELGVRQLDGDDGGQALAAVLAGDLVGVGLDDATMVSL